MKRSFATAKKYLKNQEGREECWLLFLVFVVTCITAASSSSLEGTPRYDFIISYTVKPMATEGTT